ncbi:MAG: transcriptional regulator [Syntrophaceae bacterium]|nr:MAG: transcriptional regulator [Syntrophaceae bacterium]
MQAHTKKRPIDTIEVKFIGPIINMARAIEALKPMGFVDTSDSVAWREAYPECSEEQLTGRALAGARSREGLTQVQLSKLTGIPQRHISEMEHGKRTIGKKNAKLFAEALNTDYRVFL